MCVHYSNCIENLKFDHHITFFHVADGQQIYQILYEEVDEECVDILNILPPSGDGSTVDEYRYPRAGWLVSY